MFMNSNRLRALLLPALLASATLLWGAQPVPVPPTAVPEGDFEGQLGPLKILLHLAKSPQGQLTGTLDSPNQGARGIPVADIRVDGATLSLRVPAVNGTWTGTISSDTATLAGTWSQGTPAPLVFKRNSFVPADKPLPVDGIWLGSLPAQGQGLRVQLVVRSGSKGELVCTVDVIEQNAWDVGCTNAAFTSGELSFEVPAVTGRWQGRLSADGNGMAGTWTQRNPANGSMSPPVALNITRQAKRVEPTPPPPVSFDPAKPPVDAAQLEAVLRDDLNQTLTAGVLAPGKAIGVSIGVVTKSGRRVFALGAAKPDSLFEIGSITKTFTGLTLAQLIEQGKVKADTPVRELLTAGVVAKPAGAEITLLDLVTQRSGLPRMPTNFAPADPTNPYADYGARQLEAFIAQVGVAKPADARFLYSNVGVGLLGHALSRAAEQPWPQLVAQQVLQPLGMQETVVAVPPALRARFIAGHDGRLAPAHAWDLDALAGAGALRSTAEDMLRYLEAQLKPDDVKAASPAGRNLPAALKRSQQLQADADAGLRIAYAWLHDPSSGNWWHNGGTGGYSSYAFFNPKEGYAAIVLVNMAAGTSGSFADALGQHVGQRLGGKPAISLSRW
jgi:D-alanyl-D-alanine-carboxypeptidase/D-alanyl-D-alanine-endopeptidase